MQKLAKSKQNKTPKIILKITEVFSQVSIMSYALTPALYSSSRNLKYANLNCYNNQKKKKKTLLKDTVYLKT